MIWIEYAEDVFRYYEWINSIKYNNPPRLKAFSMNYIYNNIDEPREILVEMFSNELIEKFNMNDKLYGYILLVIALKNKKSRIERHKKVWKKLAMEGINLSNFNLGPELEIEIGNLVGYVSVARFKIELLYTVLNIALSHSSRRLIIISDNCDYTQEDKVRDLFKSAFTNLDGDDCASIQYLNCVMKHCTKGDAIVKVWDAGDELELALIGPSDKVSMFK